MSNRNYFADYWSRVPVPKPLTDGQCRYAQRVLGLKRVVPLPGYPGYGVSLCGQVVSSLHTSNPTDGRYRVLKQVAANGKHFAVNLRVGRQYRRRLVHRLVALAFLGKPPEGRPMVLHRDDVPSHNTPGNLYYGNRADNVRDALRNGRYLSGERNPAAKLTLSSARELRREAAAGTPRAELLSRFGISQTTLNHVLANRRWAEPAAAA